MTSTFFICIIILEEEKDMKKHGLFKIVGILLFLLIITTFFVPGRGSQIANIGIIDVVLNALQSIYYFFSS